MAVMAAHDVLANRVVDLALRQGQQVPRDISVLGVGNHDLHCKLSPVPISSIDANLPEIAVRGAELIEKMLTGRKRIPSITVCPKGVVERASTQFLCYGDDLIGKIVAHIRENVGTGISVRELTQIFPISYRTLCRRFENHVGHSPAAEIRKARLETACRMITDTDLSLTEIALLCGYADLPHMDRSFQQAFGHSPRTYPRGKI